MRIITYWSVSIGAGEDGRISKTVGRFSSEELAREFAKTKAGRDAWGGEGRVSKRTIEVMDRLEDYLAWNIS